LAEPGLRAIVQRHVDRPDSAAHDLPWRGLATPSSPMRLTMKTILVPVDGSQHSIRALETALAMAREKDEITLHVITVQAPIVSGNITQFISARDLAAFYEDEGRKALEPVRHLLDQAGVAFTEQVLVGQIAETIVDYARRHDCDHIVMGTRGLGRMGGLLLGSTTIKVISLAAVPVTLVK
jgi:nucleotide-binding universal stress UspA family protein